MRTTIAICLAICLAAIISPALAVDFSQVLTDEKGQAILQPIEGKPNTTEPVTLGSVATQALFAVYPDEQNLAAQEKFERGMLGLQISNAKGNLDLAAEQTAMVKKLIAKAYGPLIVVRAWAILDPASK